MLPEMVVSVMRILLALMWCIAATAKLRGIREFTLSSAVLLRPINSRFVVRSAYSIPFLELVTALLLLFDYTSTIGLALSAFLLWAFSLILLRGYRLRVQVGCNCFGPSRTEEITKFALARTTGLALLATVGLSFGIAIRSSNKILWAAPAQTIEIFGLTLAAICVLVLTITALWLVTEVEQASTTQEVPR